MIKEGRTLEMSLNIEEIKTIAKKITNTKERTNYNSIIKLLNSLKFDDVVVLQDLEQEKLQRFLLVSLFQIFKKLFQRNELNQVNKSVKNPDLVKFNKWCRNIYDSFKIKMLDIISTLQVETSLALDSLDLYMQLLELESIYFASNKDSPFFPNKTLKKLIIAIWSSNIIDEQTEKNIELNTLTGQSENYIFKEFIEKYYNKFVDIQYYTQSELNQILTDSNNDTENQKMNKIFNNEISNGKWLSLMNNDNHYDLANVELEVFVSNPPQVIENDSKFKSFIEKNWLIILNNQYLSFNQYKTILLVLHKRIIPHFHTPTKLMDFLTDSYNLHDKKDKNIGVIPILALNGLFELMKQFNLEYPNFYEKLYQLLTTDLMHVKYRARFFRLMELFLSSTHVSVHLIASFIKRLARLSLEAPPSAIVSVIPFIYNLLKKHPNCMIMIHNPRFISNAFQTPEEKDELRLNIKEYKDPFDMNEQNPENTQAFDSSLWELASLMDHYHPNVATLAKIFNQPFRKMSYNMEDFLDWSYDSLLKAESERKLKVLPTLEFQSFDSMLVAATSSNDNTDDIVDTKETYLNTVAW